MDIKYYIFVVIILDVKLLKYNIYIYNYLYKEINNHIYINY